MTVRELQELLEGHDPDAMLLVYVPGGQGHPIRELDDPASARGWHIQGERTPVVTVELDRNLKPRISNEPLPPETVTVEIPREIAKRQASRDKSGVSNETIRLALDDHDVIAEACRKALGGGE